MKPYYEDESVVLYHGDSLELADIWTTADVLVTDPPYGINYTGFGGRKDEPRRTTGRLTIHGDLNTAIRDGALEAWGNKPAIVFGKWTQPRPEGTKQRLIWDKRPCGYLGNVGSPWASVDEEIYILGNWPPVKPGGRRREGGNPARGANIIAVPTLNSQARDRPDHPTPKPIPLMEALITKCPPGVIADPFTGSGATLVAAQKMGRKAVGIELEERYCELTATRLTELAMQDTLDLGALA